MNRILGRRIGVLTIALAAGTLGGFQATEDAEISPGFVFDVMGSHHCETVPPGMGEAEVEAVFAQAIEADAAPLRGRMQGFMEGERIGVSVFGSRTDDAGLAVVSSVMGPHPAGGHATLCLAMIQLGDVPVAPGEYPVVGAGALDTAAPGDVLVVGRVVRLEATGSQSDQGREIYRLENLGDAEVSGGRFDLTSVDGERFQARIELRGEVTSTQGSNTSAFSLEATSWGERGLERIPSLTLAP